MKKEKGILSFISDTNLLLISIMLLGLILLIFGVTNYGVLLSVIGGFLAFINNIPRAQKKPKGFGGLLLLFCFGWVISMVFNLAGGFALHSLFNLVIGIAQIYVSYLIINKRKNAPRLIIIILTIVAISNISREYWYYPVLSVLWIIYFWKSKRVKNTFVNK